MESKGAAEAKLMEKTLLEKYRAGQVAQTADALMKIKTEIKLIQKSKTMVRNTRGT